MGLQLIIFATVMEVGCGDALGHCHHCLLGHMEGRFPVGMVLVEAPGAQFALDGAGIDGDQHVARENPAILVFRRILEQD